MPDDRPTGFAPDDPAPAKRKGGRADWRAEGEAATKTRGKGGLIVLTLFLLLAVGGAIVGILTWPTDPVDPLFVAVPVGEYADPAWPVNPWADRDAALLAESFPPHGGRPASTKRFAFQERDKFRDLLAWVAGAGGTLDGAAVDVAKRPLVLHVTALAATDGKALYLVPGDAVPANPATWVPVDELLDALGKSRAPKKLLFLDLAHPTADPFIGPLRDDAAARLHDLLAAREKEGRLPFPVLTPCGSDEFSLTADAQRCSGFAFYLAEGLRGAADGYLDGRDDTKKTDGKVTVAELAKFVTVRVERWARVAHDRKQAPKLYGFVAADHEFFVTEGTRTKAPDPEPPAAYPPALVTGWTLRDRQRETGGDRTRPIPVSRLTAGLFAAERVWLGSGEESRAELRLADARAKFRQQVPESAPPDPAADKYKQVAELAKPFRIATARRGQPESPDASVPLKEYLREYIAATTANPKLPLEKADQHRAAWRKVVTDKLDAAASLMKVVAAWEAPTQKDAVAWDAAFNHPELAAGPYSETLLVALLAQRNIPQKQRLGEYPSAGVAQLLRAEWQASLAFAAGAEGFTLVADRMKKAEDDRAAGQTALFGVGIQNVERAEPLLKGAADEFTKVAEALARWQAASRAFSGATAALLDTLSAELDGPQFEQWLAAATRTAELGEAMSRVRAKGGLEASDISEKLVRDVHDAERALVAPYVPDTVDKLLKVPRPNRDALAPLARLTRSALLPAAKRKDVWDALRQDLARFHDKARENDAADDGNQDQSRNATAAPEAGRLAERDLVVRRAQASLALLKVAGARGVGELDRLLARLNAEPDSADLARELAARLREAWKTGLPADARAAQVAPPGRPDVQDFAEEQASKDARLFEAALARSLKADAPHRGTTGDKAAKFYGDAENNLRTD